MLTVRGTDANESPSLDVDTDYEKELSKID